MKKKNSKRWELSHQDLRKVLINASKYLCVGIVIFLTRIQMGESIQEAAAVFQYWALSSTIDLLTKFSQER